MTDDPEDSTRPLHDRPVGPDFETTPDTDLSSRIKELMDRPSLNTGESGKLSAAEILEQLQAKSEAASSSDDPDTRQLRALPKVTTDLQPWRVIFQTMTPDARVVGVDVVDVAVVGRSDPTSNIIPDLDLADHDAQAHGVSRRHAILLPTEEGLCLIDLDSTNGTWINGVYLQPGQRYRLRSGDRVEFGRLRLVVRVVGSMLQGGSSHHDETAVTRPKPRRR